MNYRALVFSVILAFTAGIFCACQVERLPEAPENDAKQEYPGEWMYAQRAYPSDRINSDVYRAAILQARQFTSYKGRSQAAPWEQAGPYNIGGRITDILLHPTDTRVIYASAANGGVFRSEDGGDTWEHIFYETGRLSIGDMAMAPSNPDRIYVGTGDASGSATSGAFFGDGMYRSDDGGDTWFSIGLDQTNHIARVVVDPADADRIYVAATGLLYGKNNARGIFRSLDGGLQWEQVLFTSDSTGAVDIAIDTHHPDTLFAAMWERQRYPQVRDYGGPGSGVYRSVDGGDSWERMTNGLPTHDQVGRIGLTTGMDGAVYAAFSENQVTNDFSGLYKSLDAGASWDRVDDFTLEFDEIYSGFGWYFGNVRVNPTDPDNVYVLGLRSWRSNDGGNTWEQHTPNYVHVDHHALEVHPLDPDLHVLGCDGGIYISHDAGESWLHVETLPVNEFYACEIDRMEPHRYYGGAQDNGTLRTLSGDASEWERIFGGDGFYTLVDPTDNNIIYCEYQWGNLYKSIDGGFDWDYALSGIDGFDRTNWNTPFAISPHNHLRMYYGTHRLYTSDDGAESWTLISEDLTNTDPDSPGGESFGALSTIAVAPSDSNVIYTGAEDGYVFVTFDHGENWQRISDDLPIRYVTRVAVDPFDAQVAYVTISGYKHVDYMPHIFRTVDGGSSWEDISGNLPEVPLNDVIIDPDLPATLYVASDLGVWYTDDLGFSWNPLGDGLPMTVFTDLTLDVATRKLLAASFGLSMFTYDLGDPVTSLHSVSHQTISGVTVSPNPIGSQAVIEFSLLVSDRVTIEVYNIQGSLLQKFAESSFPKGAHIVDWSVYTLPAGPYVVAVRGTGGVVSRIVEVL